jgi:uncharacterized membrane protein YesL
MPGQNPLSLLSPLFQTSRSFENSNLRLLALSSLITNISGLSQLSIEVSLIKYAIMQTLFKVKRKLQASVRIWRSRWQKGENCNSPGSPQLKWWSIWKSNWCSYNFVELDYCLLLLVLYALSTDMYGEPFGWCGVYQIIFRDFLLLKSQIPMLMYGQAVTSKGHYAQHATDGAASAANR